ncbi:efflux RND transporter periplasmic adaptor subunit [Endozoicomonadaceae bacterium StTr2]
MIKRMAAMAAVLTLVFGGVFGYKYFEGQMVAKFMSGFTPPPISVSAETAATDTWDQYLYGTGSLNAVQGIELAAETSGIVKALHFKAGDTVTQGQLLLELDDSVEQANLRSAQAQLKLAKLKYKRDQELVRKNAISQTKFDETSAALEQAVASVEQIKATIAKKRITAPFDGKLGIRKIEIGDFLDKGKIIANLENLQQMYVDFTIPAQDWPQVKNGQRVLFEVPAYNDTLTATVISTAVKVDDNTRNIQIRALTDNPQEKLLPGMFASVRIVTGDQLPVVTIPATSIAYNLYGSTVYVVTESSNEAGEASLQVISRTVTAGEKRDGRTAILAGVKAGEQVVTAGQLKLRNNARVTLVPEAPAAPSADTEN